MEKQMAHENIDQTKRAGAPSRDRPADFREQFVRRGWDCVDHYSTSWKVIARWLDEEGREAVKADRKAFRQLLGAEQRFATIAEGNPSAVAVHSARALGRLIADVGATIRQPLA
jgi:hypothetical protein